MVVSISGWQQLWFRTKFPTTEGLTLWCCTLDIYFGVCLEADSTRFGEAKHNFPHLHIPVMLIPLTLSYNSSCSFECFPWAHFKNTSSLWRRWTSSCDASFSQSGMSPCIAPLLPLYLSIYPNTSLWFARINNSVTSILCSRSPVHRSSRVCINLFCTKWQVQVRHQIPYIFHGDLNERSMWDDISMIELQVMATLTATPPLVLVIGPVSESWHPCIFRTQAISK